MNYKNLLGNLQEEKKSIFLFIILCFCNYFFGQLTATGNLKKIDSLLKVIQTEKKDTTQVNNLNYLGFEYSVIDFPKSRNYFIKAEKLARILHFKKGIANSLSYLGIAYETQGNYFEALNAQFKALKIREEIKDRSGISYSIHYIGDIYFGQSDLSDKISLKNDYNNKALKEFFKALKIAEEIKDIKSIANTLNCIGNSYRENQNYSLAINYYLKAIEIRKQIGDKINLSTTYVNIGKLFLKQKYYSKALNYLFMALNISNELGHKRTIVKANGTIGTIYFEQKKYNEAIIFCIKSLDLAKEIGYLEYIAKANKMLSQIYSARDFNLHDGNKALEFFKAYVLEKENIDTKKANQAELLFEFNKKEELMKLEYTKQIAISDAEKKKQKIIIWSIVCGLFFVLIFAGFILRSLQLTRKQKIIIEQQEKKTLKQKKLLEEKQKEIVDSINYAKRLQQAILPPAEFIYQNIPNSFILYKPKDIVAGDFYWAEKVGEKFFIAAADSTGHGVPGAMVSVVCSNALNRTIKEFDLTDTGKILDKTRELVIETFEKSNEDVKDGMDISLLCIDSKNKDIFWSGANNPLWYIQNNVLKEIKADKQPIGKTDYPKPFFTHQIEYIENTMFYLFTDGLADQFGGQNGKKFKYKQFEDILIKINHKSIKEQLEFILQNFEEWKGNLEQVDDVCVIGIKI